MIFSFLLHPSPKPHDLTELCCYNAHKEEFGCWLENAQPSELFPGLLQEPGKKLKLEMGKQELRQEMVLEHPSVGCSL